MECNEDGEFGARNAGGRQRFITGFRRFAPPLTERKMEFFRQGSWGAEVASLKRQPACTMVSKGWPIRASHTNENTRRRASVQAPRNARTQRVI
jgi:hypothetical protein